jgi:hypothetical protein
MNIMHSMYNIKIAAYVLFFLSQRIKELNNNSVSYISLGIITCVDVQIVCRVSRFTFFSVREYKPSMYWKISTVCE